MRVDRTASWRVRSGRITCPPRTDVVPSRGVKSIRIAIAVVVSLVAAVAVGAQKPSSEGLEVLRLRPNFYLLAGAGGNVAVQVGEDGVVVVDSGSAETAGAIVTAIRQITPAPIRYIINTSAD